MIMDHGHLIRGMTFHFTHFFVSSSLLVLYLFLYLFTLDMFSKQTAMDEFNCFTATSWNMNCKFRAGKPYLLSLLESSTVMVLNEHALYPKELYKLKHLHSNFNAFGKSSRDLDDRNFGSSPGHCGCAIMWHQDINNCVVQRPDLGTDRMCVINIKLPGCIDLWVIGVYLPYQGCKLASFVEELTILEELIINLNSTGTVMILGDINAHIGFRTTRSWGISSYTGKIFDSCMNRNDMIIADLLPSTTGPNYTFNRNDRYSYVDHCVISKRSIGLVLKTEIVDSALDVSDHLAVRICINVKLPKPARPLNTFHRVAWTKLSPENINNLYSLPLEFAIQNLLVSFDLDPRMIRENTYVPGQNNDIDLNRFVQCLTEQMRNAASKLPTIQFNKSAKPFWNSDIKLLKQSAIKAHKSWVQAGRPREPDNLLFKNYKATKKLFQKSYDLAEIEYEVKEMDDFANNGELDQRYFWHFFNKVKRGFRGISPIKDETGNLITDVNEIRNEWNRYYAHLFSDDYEYKGDPQFYESICDELEFIRSIEANSPYLKGGVITYTEVCLLISKLKNMKACGWDEISNEHLKYSGDLTKATITWLLNKIVETEFIPRNLKRGFIISLPKPNKDPTVKSDNRGITLLCVLYKLLETIIYEREKQWIFDHEVMNEIQGAGRKKISCLHTSFLVQEGVSYCLDKYKKACQTCLDIMKAFDSVWLAGFLVKLHRAGMHVKTWRLLDQAYIGFECAAFVGGIPAEWFIVMRGVRQGAPLSMPFYQISFNDLIVDLRYSNAGIVINGINATSPAHADDLALVAPYRLAMNKLLSIAYKHSIVWFYDFGITKCFSIEWGDFSQGERQIPIKLGPHSISIVSQTKHMGLMLTNNAKECHDTYLKRISDMKSVVFAGRALGSQLVPVVPSVMNRIYNSVAVPRGLYGFEVVPINYSGLQEMEKAQKMFAKVIQGLPNNCPSVSVLATMGWLTIESRIAILKLVFLWRILCLPLDSIYRRVLLHFLQAGLSNENYFNANSPTCSMLIYVRKFNLVDILQQCMFSDNSSQFQYYKSLIKRIVIETEINRWKVTSMFFYEIPLFTHCIKNIELCIWWKFVKNVPSIFKQVSSVVAVVSGTQPKQFQCNFNEYYCRLCTIFSRDTAEHILFECTALNDIRNMYFSKLKFVMPFAMKRELMNMNNREKLYFLLSGLESEFCTEWISIYRAIAIFVHEMYRRRKRIYCAP